MLMLAQLQPQWSLPPLINHHHYPKRRKSFSFSIPTVRKRNAVVRFSNQSINEDENQAQGVDFQVLAALRSNYNDIVIVDNPTSRLLLLDSTHTIHSIMNKDSKWTDSYWDEFATLPPIVPEGPIAILGLGGGTAAHLMLDLWPSLQLEGWEIDEIMELVDQFVLSFNNNVPQQIITCSDPFTLINKAREYLGLSHLEKYTQAGGTLEIRIGDALSPSEDVSGTYAGIIVDLFSHGKVLEQMQEISTWLELNNRLMPNGRIMVNCGGATEESRNMSRELHPISTDEVWVQNSTIKTLCKSFAGNLSWKRMPQRQGENYLALTGPLPDLTAWSTKVPLQLSETVKQWRFLEPGTC